MGTHPIFESDFDCLTEMIKLVLRYSSNKPVKAKPQPTGLPAFRAKLNEKKSVKRMVLEKRKSDVLLDKGGTMFKVQAQFSAVMLAGSLYAFYMAYLDEDLDELLSSNEKASL